MTGGDRKCRIIAKYTSHFIPEGFGPAERAVFSRNRQPLSRISMTGARRGWKESSTAANRLPVWHVICSAGVIELVARVPRRFGRLVQELPPGREKSAQDTAG
jgi:hypothetical protein